MHSKEFNEIAEVRRHPDKGDAIFAIRDIRAGERIGYFEGDETKVNSVHAIHLDGKLIDGTGALRFLSHSCDPNAVFTDKKRWLFAKADIPKGTEVTIDYLHTEPAFTQPFKCECRAEKCRGMIGGPGS